MDDSDRMDLVLNADFDSALLDCWDDTTKCDDVVADSAGGKDGGIDDDEAAAAAAASMVVVDRRGSWEHPSSSALPSFLMDDDVDDMQQQEAATNAASDNDDNKLPAAESSFGSPDSDPENYADQPLPGVAAPLPATSPSTDASLIDLNGTCIVPGEVGGGLGASMVPSSQPPQSAINQHPVTAAAAAAAAVAAAAATQLHPLAIQSSANCPPHSSFAYDADGNGGTNRGAGQPALRQQQQQPQQQQPQQQNARNTSNPMVQSAAVLPLAMNALAAGMPLNNPLLFPASMTMASTATNATNGTNHSAAPSKTTSSRSGSGSDETGSTATTGMMVMPKQSDLPPFLLFDAPAELRANFAQAQRSHGMPVMQDNNSVHYAMAAAAAAAATAAAAASSASSNAAQQQPPQQQQQLRPQQVAMPPADKIKLVDSRHGDAGDKRLKNAKEQKRAQKITELIDQLRCKMENGGWKVGLKSKFHTLSSCAEYVKHLVQVNRGKEEAVEKAKVELKCRKRKLEEEKAQQQDPSDPESTTSSLTSSDSAGTAAGGVPGDNNRGASGNTAGNTNPSETTTATTTDEDKQTSDIIQKEDVDACKKKARLGSQESTSSDESARLGVRMLNVDHTSSSVSDITTSKDGSTSSSKAEENASDAAQKHPAVDDHNDRPSSAMVSSDSGITSGEGDANDDAQKKSGNHTHVVIQGRKRKGLPSKETTSLDESFELDYQEVFVKSNVPQILATTSGKIVAWNEFFLKITALTEEEVDRLTIFSLVRADRLSDLFEIVATALRSGSFQTSGNDSNKEDQPSQVQTGVDEDKPTEQLQQQPRKVAKKQQQDPTSPIRGDESQQWNYSAITLPCVDFRVNDSKKHVLFVTVTLMPDEDPKKRCFHCVLTDSPGTNGALGSITPDLLAQLFVKSKTASPTTKTTSTSTSNASLTKKAKKLRKQ